jgi:hypothetical protein
MTSRFECRFAVGANGLAYSGVWLVFTAKKKPDLYIAVKTLSGALKATVHCPRPPEHPNYGRHFGFVNEANDALANAVRKDGTRHIVTWTGYRLDPNYTLEYRIIVRGISLSATGQPVEAHVKLLPMPSEHECVEVGVLLGEPTKTYPKEINGATYLLDEGYLCDGRRVWIICCVKSIREPGVQLPASKLIKPAKSYFAPDADLKSDTLRAMLFGAQPDGSLGFMDCKATLIG